MNIKGSTRIVGIIVLIAGCLVSGQLLSQTKVSDGYTLEDFSLRTAADLVDLCRLDMSHQDHVTARAFCYGFFEGGIHYAEAISTSPNFTKLVCAPPNTTRTEAVDVFVTYVQANPQYASKRPIDTIYRALVDKWPCDGFTGSPGDTVPAPEATKGNRELSAIRTIGRGVPHYDHWIDPVDTLIV